MQVNLNQQNERTLETLILKRIYLCFIQCLICFYVPVPDCSSSRSVKSASLPVELPLRDIAENLRTCWSSSHDSSAITRPEAHLHTVSRKLVKKFTA
jgi:hypothetical protein